LFELGSVAVQIAMVSCDLASRETRGRVFEDLVAPLVSLRPPDQEAIGNSGNPSAWRVHFLDSVPTVKGLYKRVLHSVLNVVCRPSQRQPVYKSTVKRRDEGGERKVRWFPFSRGHCMLLRTEAPGWPDAGPRCPHRSFRRRAATG
jgi:hypothetical protein